MKCELVGIATAVRSKYLGRKRGGYFNGVDIDFSGSQPTTDLTMSVPAGISQDALAMTCGRGMKFKLTIETIE